MNASTLELVLDAGRLQHSLGRDDRLGPPSSNFGGSSRSYLPFNLLIRLAHWSQFLNEYSKAQGQLI